MSLPDPYKDPEIRDVVDVQSAPSDRLDFGAIVATFRRRFWLFVCVAGAVFAVAAVFTFTQSPVYTASARLMIDVAGQDVAPSTTEQAAPPPNITSDNAIDTEVAIVQSRALAIQVVNELNLTQDPDFNFRLASRTRPRSAFRSVLSGIKAQIFGAEPEGLKRLSEPVAADSAVMDDVVDAVLSGVSARRAGQTYAIDLSYTASEPEKAARIANAFAAAYATYNLDQKIAGNRQAVALLEGRVEALRQQAELDTAAVQQYRIANNLLSTTGQSVTEQEISVYNQQVATALAEASEDAARLGTARQQLRNGSAGDDVGEALTSPVVQSLRTQRAQVSSRVADLQGRYGPRYPDVITANNQLKDIDAQIQAEINRVISNLEAKSQVSRQRVASLQGSLGGAKSSLRSNNEAMVRLDELTRKAEASQSLYESYLNRLGQTSAQEGTLRPEARIISPARAPYSPSAPNIPLYLVFGAMCGAGAGILAAFLAEMLSTSLTTAEDVERRLGRPYLGSIPLLSSIEGGGANLIDSVVRYQRSAYAEAFRNLRTALQFSRLGGEPKVILITSALPQEGKTTTSIGFARSMALHGRKTILIDGDLRRRGVNRLTGKFRARFGIIEVLSGEATLQQAIIVDEGTGLHVLTVCDTTQDQDYLLTSEAMDALLKRLRETYDAVVIDGPPIMPVADGRGLATKADVVVFAVRWRKTREQAVRAALRLLPRNDVNLGGILLTAVDMRKQSRYGYGDAGFYYKQYKSYYG